MKEAAGVRMLRRKYDPDMSRRPTVAARAWCLMPVGMGFRAPDYFVRRDIFPWRSIRFRVVPDSLGSFEFRCDGALRRCPRTTRTDDPRRRAAPENAHVSAATRQPVDAGKAMARTARLRYKHQTPGS